MRRFAAVLLLVACRGTVAVAPEVERPHSRGRTPDAVVAPVVRARPRPVGDCAACSLQEFCSQVVGGEAPPRGQPARVTSQCEQVPPVCQASPSCECLASRAGIRAQCTAAPNGTLRVLTLAP